MFGFEVLGRIPRPSWRLLHLCCLLQSPGQIQRRSYVPLLAVLVAPGQKDDQRLASLHEVHPVARPVIDTNLRYSFSHRPHVAWIAKAQTPDSAVDAHSRLPVPKPPEPAGVDICLPNLYHDRIVFYRIPRAQWIGMSSSTVGVVESLRRPAAVPAADETAGAADDQRQERIIPNAVPIQPVV